MCTSPVVVVSYRHSAVVVVCCRRPSSSSIAVVSLPAFVIVALCPCSCRVVSCRHLLVSQVSWVRTGVLTDGRQTTNLSSCKISVRGVSGGRGRKKRTIVFELSVRSQHGITWRRSSNGLRNLFHSELGNSTPGSSSQFLSSPKLARSSCILYAT